MSRVSIPTLIIGVLVVAILVTFACTYQVSFNEAAIRVRFGKALETVTEPGLKFRVPWPVESIARYDTRLRTLDSPEVEIKTIDGKNVIVGTYAIWRVADPLQFFLRARTEPKAEEQMRVRIAQMQAAVIGQKSLPYFFSLDRDAVEANYETLLKQMRDEIAPGLLADYGIALEEVGIRRISLPKEVTQKVFESMIQERKRLAETYRSEGRSQADAIKARAEAEAKQILAFADRKAQDIRSAGIQASTRILARINESDREFFEWLRWLDTLRATFKQKTTVFIDQESPLFKPFVHPPALTEPSSAGPRVAPTPETSAAAQ